MKTGISIGGYKVFGDGKYQKMRAHGYECCDFDMSDTETEIYSCSEPEFEKLLLAERMLAKNAGITLHQIHGPWRWPVRDNTEEERAERLHHMKRSIRGAAILGSKFWVIHPIMPFGIYDVGTGKEQETWQINLEFMAELVKAAKEWDVIICCENMPFPKFSIAAPDVIGRLVREIGNENFKMCLDTGHAAIFNGVTPASALREFGDIIRVLHVHDNDGLDDRHFLPYFGVIDWADFKKALKDVCFEGVLSLEAKPGKTLPASLYEKALQLTADIARDLAE